MASALQEGQWLGSKHHSMDSQKSADGEAESLPMEQPPQHPVASLQGAFDESLLETLAEDDLPDQQQDSVARRKTLLEAKEYTRTVAGRWKQRPGEKFHPLWKLVAQISFGMHLLHQELAKSDEDVIRILQTHVDDIDGFLERTTEDFDLAQNDISERIKHLRLPLEHGEVFDQMLDDKKFRTDIVEGNEKIEHIVTRTAVAMKDALKDVQKGLDGTRELSRYLKKLDRTWNHKSEEHAAVFQAMQGNTQGWTGAYIVLQQKGSQLQQSLSQLEGIISELQRRAGIASRRNLGGAHSSASQNSQPQSRSHSASQSRNNLPLSRISLSPSVQSPRSNSSQPGRFHGQNSNFGKLNPARSSSGGSLNNTSRFPLESASNSISQTSGHSPATSPSTLRGRGNQYFDSQSSTRRPSAGNGPEPASGSRKVSFTSKARNLTRRLSWVKDSDRPGKPFHHQSHSVSLRASPKPNSRDEKKTIAGAVNGVHPEGARSQPEQNTSSSPYDLDQILKSDSTRATRSPQGNATAIQPPPLPRTIQQVMSDSEDTPRKEETAEPRVEPHQDVLPEEADARGVRFMRVKPTVRDLPLRHFASQESLPLDSQRGSKAVATSPRRANSARDKRSSLPASLTASSASYSPGGGNLSSDMPSGTQFLSPLPNAGSARPSPLRLITQPREHAISPPPATAPLAKTEPLLPPSPPLHELVSATVSGPQPDLPFDFAYGGSGSSTPRAPSRNELDAVETATNSISHTRNQTQTDADIRPSIDQPPTVISRDSEGSDATPTAPAAPAASTVLTLDSLVQQVSPITPSTAADPSRGTLFSRQRLFSSPPPNNAPLTPANLAALAKVDSSRTLQDAAAAAQGDVNLADQYASVIDPANRQASAAPDADADLVDHGGLVVPAATDSPISPWRKAFGSLRFHGKDARGEARAHRKSKGDIARKAAGVKNGMMDLSLLNMKEEPEEAENMPDGHAKGDEKTNCQSGGGGGETPSQAGDMLAAPAGRDEVRNGRNSALGVAKSARGSIFGLKRETQRHEDGALDGEGRTRDKRRFGFVRKKDATKN